MEGQLSSFVDSLVDAGRYNSKNEVVEELKRAFQEGVNSGRGNDADVVFDRLEEKYSKVKK